MRKLEGVVKAADGVENGLASLTFYIIARRRRRGETSMNRVNKVWVKRNYGDLWSMSTSA